MKANVAELGSLFYDGIERVTEKCIRIYRNLRIYSEILIFV